ncbi:hypothetical protein [Rhizobium sp. Root483D2]|uniref:hypothetical protein n=1 Tax=Rhizobium sp. Root483D2 TaxID=1736545 RepID=UPI000714E487|nr:hypothetical protein [Rhizobium sp. Root483D2]KQY21009.1 hypothetical protein ASD32_06415 [Rhizobium sp. Root483D2]
MARPKLGETDTERMQLKITAAEIAAIDDWRFSNRVPSRSEAVRRLCHIALIWDDHSERLHKKLSDVATLLNDKADEVTGLLGPADSDLPKWALDYVVASMTALSEISEKIGELTQEIGVIGAPAAIMTIEGKFEDVLQQSKMSELGFVADILARRVEAFEKKQAEGNKE